MQIFHQKQAFGDCICGSRLMMIGAEKATKQPQISAMKHRQTQENILGERCKLSVQPRGAL
ncbi:MAG: hypothetical protein LBV12_01560 [Puniceicoccales bacterium]|nr:hypothetical protein [Puniceicoccales bacterium]